MQDMSSLGVWIPKGFGSWETFHTVDDSATARMVYIGSGPQQYWIFFLFFVQLISSLMGFIMLAIDTLQIGAQKIIAILEILATFLRF